MRVVRILGGLKLAKPLRTTHNTRHFGLVIDGSPSPPDTINGGNSVHGPIAIVLVKVVSNFERALILLLVSTCIHKESRAPLHYLHENMGEFRMCCCKKQNSCKLGGNIVAVLHESKLPSDWLLKRRASVSQ